MIFKPEMLCLYGITPPSTDKTLLYKQIEEALQGGVTMLQLREKGMSTEELIKEAIEVKKICKKYNVPLIINDDHEAAFRSGADGVHVGLDDTPVSEIRKYAPENFIIGATAKTPEQAMSAQSQGADYIGVGAVFPSPTKENAIRITKTQLSDICRSVDIPGVAIGGINYENAGELKGSCVYGIAAVSAIFGAEYIKINTANLKITAREIVKANPFNK